MRPGLMRRAGFLFVVLALGALARPALAAPRPQSVPAALGPAPAGSSGPPFSAGDLAQRQLQQLDTTEMRGFVADLDRDLGLPAGGFSWERLLQDARRHRLPLGPRAILRALAGVFAREVGTSLSLLARLLILVVLAAVLRQIRASFEREAVGRLADAVVLLALGALALAGFTLAGQVARGALDRLTSFMVAILPTLVGLLAASGAWTTAGLLHPLMVAALNAVGLAVRSWVFPLVFLAAVLDIVSSFAPTFRLTSLAAFMRQVGLGLFGLLLAGFVGVVAVQGAAGAVADGVALRAAKYAAKAFVPVVGGMFADAAELVISSGFLVRSAVGVAGLVLVALLVLVPLCKLMALWGAYRLAAALAQPVGGEEIARVLGGIASTLSLVAVAVAAVGLMFFLALAVLVGASGAVLTLG
jgi:stage III sporulation protein AE